MSRSEDLERQITHDRPKPESPRPLPGSNRVTHTNSHGLIDIFKQMSREWLDELEIQNGQQ